MSAGTGKTRGEGNVHVARWRVQASKMTIPELVALYHRLPLVPGVRGYTARQLVLRRELEARGQSLRDLGIDS